MRILIAVLIIVALGFAAKVFLDQGTAINSASPASPESSVEGS